MMQPILAEFCGRWGCTWQEGIFNLILGILFSKGGWVFLAGLIFLVGLFFVGGFLTVYEFLVGADIATGSIDQRIDRLKKPHQKGKKVLPKVRILGRTAKVVNKAIKNHRKEENVVNSANSQQQDISKLDENTISNETDSIEPQPQRQQEENIVNQANFQQQDIPELDENTVSNKADSVEPQPQRQRLQQAAKFLGRTAKVANKTIKDYREEENVVKLANSQQQDIPKLDENAISNETDSVEPQPQHQRILKTAKFLGRNLRNITKD